MYFICEFQLFSPVLKIIKSPYMIFFEAKRAWNIFTDFHKLIGGVHVFCLQEDYECLGKKKLKYNYIMYQVINE